MRKNPQTGSVGTGHSTACLNEVTLFSLGPLIDRITIVIPFGFSISLGHPVRKDTLEVSRQLKVNVRVDGGKMPQPSTLGTSLSVELVVGKRERPRQVLAGDGINKPDKLIQTQRAVAPVRFAVELGVVLVDYPVMDLPILPPGSNADDVGGG